MSRRREDVLLTVMSGVVTPYFQRVMATVPIAYWALDDAAGPTAIDKMALGNGAFGAGAAAPTPGQVGIGDGKTAYSFDGGDCVNIYSAALNTAFNHDECTLMCWMKIAAAQWGDATTRVGFQIRSDVNNRINLSKTTTLNQLQALCIRGSTVNTVQYTYDGREIFFQIAITVSVTADEVKMFINGSQVGNTVNSLGTWADPGALNSGACAVGSALGASAASPFVGSLAHVAVWSRALTPTEVASLASPFDSSVTLWNLLTVGDSKTNGTGDDAGVTPPGYQAPLCLLLHTATGQYWSENPPRIGVGGLDMSELEARVDADIAAMTDTPNEILINMGANDVGAGFNKAVWKASYIYAVSAYHTAFPNANIRLAKIWVRDTGTQAAAIALQNAAIDEMYAAYTWLKTGINEALFLEGGDDGATYTTDGTHPNHAGYALEAAAWKDAITA